MRAKQTLYLGVAAIAFAAAMTGAPARLAAQQDAAIHINDSDLGGVVSGTERARIRRVGDRGKLKTSDGGSKRDTTNAATRYAARARHAPGRA